MSFGFVERAARHVFDMAIGVVRDHRELLLAAKRHRALLWKYFDVIDDRIVRAAVGHALPIQRTSKR